MNITVLCSDAGHPVVPRLESWIQSQAKLGNAARLVFDKGDLTGGDILFLVSCSQLIDADLRSKFRATLVLHASALPQGRGWSPHVWAIVGGSNFVTVSLLEAADKVDQGAIWLQEAFTLEGHELLPEINARLFECELSLMSRAVNGFGSITPVAQAAESGTYLRKRTPLDSKLDPHKSIAEQFNLLRVVDSERYPAFFELNGHRYLLKIEKVSHDD
jgi:methionyl-tRNA formyltransferase